MTTLSMQQAADLAGVTRQAITVWRGRYGCSQPPFPVVDENGRLDRTDFVEWLVATGRADADELRAEAGRYGEHLRLALDDLSASAALLLVQHQLGGTLAEVDVDEAFEVFADPSVADVVDPDVLEQALANRALVSAVDELVEADYTAGTALDTLLRAASTAKGAAEAASRLGVAGERLLAPVLSAVLEDRAVQPVGAAAVAALLSAVWEAAELRGRVLLPAPRSPWERAACTRILLADLRLSLMPGDEIAHDATVLVVRPELRTDDVPAFLDHLADVHVQLGPAGRLVVVAPTAVLVEELRGTSRSARASFLVDPVKGYTAPLRYIAALPRGLVAGGGRRRLGVWVLDAPGATVDAVLYAEHSHLEATAAHGTVLAADIRAALDQAGLGEHSYVRTRVRSVAQALTSPRLAWPAPDVVVGDPETTMAGLREAAALTDVLDLAEVMAAEPQDFALRIPWEELVANRSLRLLPGARISDSACTAGPVSSVRVLGPKEIRGERAAERHRINRLLLASHAPSARFTEPGDVVYVATGVPAAVVDTEGGNVVQAPARIARCAPPAQGRHCLSPRLLAAEIRASASSDPRGWVVHRLPAETAELVAAVGERADARRAELRRELAAIDAVEHHLLTGLATGTLRPTTTTSPDAGTEPAPTKEH